MYKTMFLRKFFFELLKVFIIINILAKYEVKSETSVFDRCIEEESERLLLKRKELSINLYSLIDVDVDGTATILSKNICDFILPSFENSPNEQDTQEIMPDDSYPYENHNRLETLKHTLEETHNENALNNDVLLEDEIPAEIQEPKLINNERIKLTVNDISNNDISNLPIEEEASPEKSCDKSGSKMTKSDIKKILTSFIKTVPLKGLIQLKLKEQKAKEREFLQQISMKQQQQEQMIPQFMYQQGVKRFG